MKKIKNLTLFVVLSTAIFFSACKKDKAPSLLQPNISIGSGNGSSITYFNTNAMAVKSSQNGQNFTVVQGRSSDGVAFSLTLYGTLEAGKTFVSGGQNADNKPVLGLVSQTDGFFNDDDDPSNLVTVTITSVSSISIQGTFKGKVTDGGILSGTPVTFVISNGQFSVNYQN